jgi:hypothetical protein
MTMTTEQPSRRNSAGDPCPPWCVTDHSKYGFHGSETITVEAPQYHQQHVRGVQFPVPAGPQVRVGGGASVYVPSGDAGELAALIEELADATPEQHRELAAAIRQAAADITDVDGGQQ